MVYNEHTLTLDEIVELEKNSTIHTKHNSVDFSV